MGVCSVSDATDADPPPGAAINPRASTRRWTGAHGTLPSSAPKWRVALNDLFAGISPTIVVTAALVCLVDAVQDVLHTVLRSPFSHSVFTVLNGFYTTALIASLFLFGVVAALNRHPVPGARQMIAVAIAVIVATSLGTLLKLHWLGLLVVLPQVDGGYYYSDALSHFVQRFVRYLTIGTLFAASFTMYRRERLRTASLLQTEVEQATLAQQLDEARLQALLAQIEPHFLFNTLANVRSLYQGDPAAAERMLDNLTRYLTVALPRMRESESTIGREAALADAYLGIQQIRMGARLAFSIDIPARLHHAALPPMMLLTLVENAIKHGLGELRDGGTITITAVECDGTLSLRVADTGRGFARHLGNGAGLANIRARLGALHGPAASLRLAVNTPRGVTATIAVPMSITGAH
jgi:hypothetical protein